MLRGVLIFNKPFREDILKIEKMAINFFGPSFVFKMPIILNGWLSHIFYLPFMFLKLLFESFRSAFFVSLDSSYIGLLVVLISFFNSKKSMIVVDHDNLWSLYLDRKKVLIPIKDFYRILPRLSFKEKIAMSINKFLCSYSDYLVFYDKETVELWENFYGFAKEKALLIKAPKPIKNHKTKVLAKKSF